NGSIALGTGTLTKTGTGKLTLGGSAASIGTGNYVISAGTLELNKTPGASAVPGGLVLGDGTTPATAKLLAANQIADAATVTVNAGSTFDLNGNADTVAAVAGTGTVTSAAPAVLSVTAGTTAALLGGQLSLTKANAGTLSVTNASNTFTGTLQVNNGILEVASLADAGAGSQGTGTIRILNGTNAGAVLRYLGPARTITRAIEVFGTGTGAGTAGLESGGTGPLTWAGDVSLSVPGAAKSFALQGENAGENVFAGKVSNGAGTLSLVKDGPNAWALTNPANDFTGNVTVNDGTLRVTTAGALGTGTKTVAVANSTYPSLALDGSAGNIVLPAGIGFTASNDGTGGRPGAIVNLAGDNVINGQVALVNGNGGNGRLTVTAGTLTLAGTVNANGATGVRTLLIGGAGNGTVSGVVADGVTSGNARVVSVQKDGTGIWSLTGANTFTGSVSVQAGTLRIGAVADPATSQPLGIATSAVTLGTATTVGTLEYAGTAAGTLARPLTVNGAGGGVVKNSGGQPLTLSGAITTSGRPLTLTGGAFDVTGVVVGTAAGSTLNVDAATVSLSAANTYNGPTNVLGGGVLRNGVANALPAATAVVVGGAAGNTGGTYDLNGFAQTVASLADAGTGARVITNNAASAAATLTVTGTGTFGGTLKDGPTATLALAKTTGGTLTLSGPNSYSGGTTISAGAVVVAAGGSLGSGPVNVGGTGTLGGAGSVAAPVQVSGGTVAPGVTAGTLSLAGGVAFTGGALSVDLNGLTPGTGHDQLLVTGGNVALGAGVATLTGTAGFVPTAGTRLWVLNNAGSGTTTGYFLDALGNPARTDGSLLFVGSQQFAVYYSADLGANALTGGNDVVLVATGVPEPSAAVAGLGLAAAGLLSRRRRSRR
ncbi:MAG TPA: autotransporter-associated beta strand repeat-containing protein, partial [Humisphaera sp.]